MEAIKVVMHDPARAKCPCASLTEALTRMLNIEQMELENLLDHVKRFKQKRDVMKSHVGKNILDGFVENTPELRSMLLSRKTRKMKLARNGWHVCQCATVTRGSTEVS